MTNRGGALEFDAVINNTDFKKQMDEMARQIRGFSNTAVSETSKVDAGFSRLGYAIGGALSATAMQQFVSKLVSVRGEFQQLEIAFTTMLRSKAKSDELMKDLVQFAATTPFDLTSTAQAAKQLLAYGSSAQSVRKELTMLGNVASGVSQPIGDIVYLYGTLRTQGRAYAMDIRQFAGRGIPIYEELAKVLGVNKDKIQGLVEAGKIGFPEVEKAFQNMTAKGGMFYNLMQAQSKSLTGQLSNLRDAFTVMINNIGRGQENILSEGISGLAMLVQNYEQVGKIITALVATYGSYKAAVLVVNAINTLHGVTIAKVADSITAESSALARETALKLDNAQSTSALAASIARETQARADAATATVAQLRSEVSELAAKKAATAEAAALALAELRTAEAKLQSATAAQTAANANIYAANQEAAAKAVVNAQNEVNIASETAFAARKEASAAASEFSASKSALETAAREANTLATAANAAATAAEAAATQADAVAATELTAAQSLRLAITNKLATAEAYLASTMLANPYVAVTVAVVGLTAAIWAMHDGTTAMERAQRDLNQAEEDAKKQREDTMSQITELNGIISSETSSMYQKLDAYGKLQQLMPSVLKNISLQQYQTMEAKKAQKEFNESLDQMEIQRVKDEFEAAQKAVKDYNDQLKKIKENPSEYKGGVESQVSGRLDEAAAKAKMLEEKIEAIVSRQKEAAEAERVANMTTEDRIRYYKQNREELEAQAKTLENTILLAKQGTKEFGLWDYIIAGFKLDRVNELIADITNKLRGLNPGIKDKAFWEDQKKKAEESLDLMDRSMLKSQKAAEQLKKYKEAESALKDYDFKTHKEPKPKKIDIALPAGSLGEIDRQIKIAELALSKIPADQVDRVKAMHETLLKLTEQRVEAEKTVEFRSWQQTLDYKRNQYLEFEKAMENSYPALAQAQYADLLKGGQTYVDFLNNQIAPLQEKFNSVGAGGMSNTEIAQLVEYTNELSTAMGDLTPMEKYRDALEDVRRSTGSLAEYVDELQRELDSLNGDTSGQALEMAKDLRDRIKSAKNDIKDLFKEYLIDTNTFNLKKQAVNKKYDMLASQARKQLNDKDLSEALGSIEKERSLALDAVQQEEIEKTDSYKRLHEEVLYYSREKLKQDIKDAEANLKMALGNVEAEKKARLELAKAQQALIDDNSNGLRAAASEISSLMGNFSIEFSKNMKISVQSLAGVMNNISTLMNFKSNNLTTGGKIANAGAIAGIINTAVLTIRDAFTDNKDLETGMEIQDKEAQALAKTLDGINYKLREQARLLDGLYGERRFSEAMKQYEELGKQEDDLLTKLKAYNFEVKTSEETHFVDPIFNLDPKKKGVQSAIVQILTLGQALQKTKYEFQSINTQDFTNIEDFRKLLETIKENGGQLGGVDVVESDLKALQDMVDTYDELEAKRKELLQQTQEWYTATTVDALADAIVQGFQQGKRSAADFAGDFQTMMQKALINSFKAKIMDDSLQAFYDKFYALAGHQSDFMLTADEIQTLKDDWDKMIAENAQKWEEFQQITGQNLSATSNDALTGAIKGMSEDTASIIAGQMNAIRINQAESLSAVREAIFHLAAISQNTSYNYHLTSIEKSLRNMQSAQWWRDMGVAD